MSAPSDPAFPAAPNPNWTDDAQHGQRGMTIRQYYKTAALQGALANSNLSDIKATKWMVQYASDLADAMLAEDLEHAKK